MDTQNQSALSLAEFFELLKRGKKTLVLCLLLAVVPLVVYNETATPAYRATAIVVFENLGKDTIMELDFGSSLQRGNFVSNRIAEMQTRTFARQVYEELPPDARQLFRAPKPLPLGFRAPDYFGGLIRRNLQVEPIRGTDLVTVSFASENPQLAQLVANTVTRVLQESNLRVRRQEFTSVKEFIDGQMQVVKERLQKAEEALRDYKTTEHITSLEDESREILQRITQAEVLYNQVQTDRGAKQRRLAVIREKLDEQKQDLAVTVTQVNSPLTIKLKEKLVELEVRYAGLQAQNYPDNHPKMVELRAEIEQTKQNVVRSTLDILEQEQLQGVIDPISQLQKYVEESILLEVELQALAAQEHHLKVTLENYARYLSGLPDKEVQLVRLLRDQEVNNKLYLRLMEEREQSRIREAAEIGNLRVMEAAEVPHLPWRPRKLLNIAIGIFAGLVAGMFLLLVREFAREAPRTQEQIEQLLHLPVLAAVPQLKVGVVLALNGRSRQRHLLRHAATLPFARDAYSYLWTSVQSTADGTLGSLMLTSAGPGEGKSTIAANLAMMAARHGRRTVLIDGDVRKPVLHKMFDLPASPGLTDLWLLAADHERDRREEAAGTGAAAQQALRQELVASLQNTNVPNLQLLAHGGRDSDPDMLWSSMHMGLFVALLKEEADLIIFDTPPLIGMPDAGLVARHVDGILLCVEAGRTEKRLLLRAQKLLASAHGTLLGIVLNKVDPAAIYGSYKHYKYYVKHYTKSEPSRKSTA